VNKGIIIYFFSLTYKSYMCCYFIQLAMKITDIIREELIIIRDSFPDKWKLIEELIGRIVEVYGLSDGESAVLREQIIQREKQNSTGIGDGVAIPHGLVNIKRDDIMGVLSVIRSGVDFEAIDGKPVYLVMLIAVPQSMFATHVRILAKAAHLLGNDEFRAKIMEANSEREIYEIIKEYEEFV